MPENDNLNKDMLIIKVSEIMQRGDFDDLLFIGRSIASIR